MRWIFLAPFVVLSSFCLGQAAPNLNGFQLLTQNDSTAFFLSESSFQCWQDAQDEFVELGGHLATFSSLAENTAVWNASLEFSPFPNVNHWIGLIQLSEVEEPSGNWSWVTGEVLTFANWAPNEPNDTYGVEEFGIFSGAGSGTWNDMPNCSSYSYKAILEIALLEVVYGCNELSACNYEEQATNDDGSCEYVTCLCLDGTIWSEELGGCIPATTCPQDLDYDGLVGVNDLMNLLSAFGTPCDPLVAEWTCGDPVSYHGYDYETVLIGAQCWFAENLRAMMYRNGDEITLPISDEEWSMLEDTGNGGMGYPNESVGAFNVFGALYNWNAVIDNRQLCPQGWHIPSHLEWGQMETFAGMEFSESLAWQYNYGNVGAAIKSAEWNCPSWNGQNVFGFSALPAGYRANGGYDSFGSIGYWWSSSSLADLDWSSQEDHGVFRFVTESGSYWFYDTLASGSNIGLSIRCIKD